MQQKVMISHLCIFHYSCDLICHENSASFSIVTVLKLALFSWLNSEQYKHRLSWLQYMNSGWLHMI